MPKMFKNSKNSSEYVWNSMPHTRLLCSLFRYIQINLIFSFFPSLFFVGNLHFVEIEKCILLNQNDRNSEYCSRVVLFSEKEMLSFNLNANETAILKFSHFVFK